MRNADKQTEFEPCSIGVDIHHDNRRQFIWPSEIANLPHLLDDMDGKPNTNASKSDQGRKRKLSVQWSVSVIEFTVEIGMVMVDCTRYGDSILLFVDPEKVNPVLKSNSELG